MRSTWNNSIANICRFLAAAPLMPQAFWPCGSHLGKAFINGIGDLALADVHVIAAAKPELAPSGLAAVQTMKPLGLWDKLQPKIVYAENINMAKQYGTSRNADAVLTAYSLVLSEAGKGIQVDEKLHHPIVQEFRHRCSNASSGERPRLRPIPAPTRRPGFVAQVRLSRALTAPTLSS